MPRNVVLVTVDSLRADHVGCYGYERDTTPALDEYAEQGHLFTSAFSHACATRPSFPGILTASHALMYGGFERLAEERTIISEVLSDQGYMTGGFHSNLYLSEEFGYGRGFNQFYDSRESPSLTKRLRRAVKTHLDTSGPLFNILQRLYDQAERTTGVNVGSYHTSAEEITDRALAWVRDDTSQRTFLWIHYMDPHHPFIPPEEYQEFSKVSRREGVRLRPKMVDDPDAVTDEELQNLIDLYDDEIRYTDAQIGRLLSQLDQQWGDWAAVVTADHGEELKDHGDFTHQNLFYDETWHVPLIVYDGQSSGIHHQMVGHSEIAPTVARWAGVDTLPESFWGYPLQPLLEGRQEAWERDGVHGSWCDYPSETRRLAYRTHDWKYIRDYVHDSEELFDMQSDPDEQRNLLENGSNVPDIVTDLRAEINQFEADIDSTTVDIGGVEMDVDVKERLQRLGYRE